MIKPLNKNIVCKRQQKPEKAKGAIIMLKEDPENTFKVIAIADDVNELAIDDRIILERYQGRELEIDGEILLFVHVNHVIAKYV